jgi:MoxR-like ATPase
VSEAWPDVVGVTEMDGHPQLPRRPAVVAALFDEVCARPEGTPQQAILEAVQRRIREEPTRLYGLAGWLPLSHVAGWASDGALRKHPGTDPMDLAIRFGAWVGSRAVARDDVPAVTRYARAVVEGVRRDLPGDDAAWGEAAAPAHEDDTPPADPLTARISRLLAALDEAFVERKDHARAVLLALLAGQHALLLGPPGTAKSLLARGISQCFRDAVWFEYLLSRFTHPDELFGPVSIPGLKQEDYRRLTEGFLPRANVAFLDEIFKANSAILNSLLTLVNERVFHHGRHRDRVPLIGIVGASNELPDPEGGLGALFDRFLVRMTVPPIAGPEAFLSVATGDLSPLTIAEDDALTPDEVRALQARAADVAVPELVSSALVRLWRKAAEAEWQVSDRRWRQAVSLMKTAAASEGRAKLGLLDLLLLEHVLAPDPRQSAEVREALVDVVAPRAAPDHDLAAQWTLLRFDRVAPLPGQALDHAGGQGWADRVARRQRHVARMQDRAEAAVQELAADRRRLEGHQDARLWVTTPPAQVRRAHILATREISKVLEACERYDRELGSPRGLARALLSRLPSPKRMDFAAGVALRLELTDAATHLGLTLAAEKVAPPEVGEPEPVGEVGAGRLSRRGRARMSFEVDAFERAPVLELSSEELVAFLRGELDITALTSRLETVNGRTALGVLQRVRNHLGDSGIPTPPSYPPRREAPSTG